VLLPVTLIREDPNSVLARYGNGFNVATSSRRTLSLDGRIMTIKTTSQDKAGLTVTSIGVYGRVARGVGTEKF
jgi:hypothetical protein